MLFGAGPDVAAIKQEKRGTESATAPVKMQKKRVRFLRNSSYLMFQRSIQIQTVQTK